MDINAPDLTNPCGSKEVQGPRQVLWNWLPHKLSPGNKC